jgi:hypothetical protein
MPGHSSAEKEVLSSKLLEFVSVEVHVPDSCLGLETVQAAFYRCDRNHSEICIFLIITSAEVPIRLRCARKAKMGARWETF